MEDHHSKQMNQCESSISMEHFPHDFGVLEDITGLLNYVIWCHQMDCGI